MKISLISSKSIVNSVFLSREKNCKIHWSGVEKMHILSIKVGKSTNFISQTLKNRELYWLGMRISQISLNKCRKFANFISQTQIKLRISSTMQKESWVSSISLVKLYILCDKKYAFWRMIITNLIGMYSWSNMLSFPFGI